MSGPTLATAIRYGFRSFPKATSLNLSSENPGAHDLPQHELLRRLMYAGIVISCMLSAGYAFLGLPRLAALSGTYVVIGMGSLAWIRWRPGATWLSLVLPQAAYGYFLTCGNAVVLGGLGQSSGIAVWLHLPLLAGMFLFDGRARSGLVLSAVLCLVGLTIADPWLVPIESLPAPFEAYFLAANVIGSAVVTLGTVAHFRRQVQNEKHALVALAKQHERVLEGMPLAVALKDGQGRFLFVNPAFANSLGHPREHLVTAGDEVWSPEDADQIRQADRHARDSSGPVVREDTIKVREATRRVRSTRLWLEDPSSQPVLVWVAEDVTDRHLARELLQRSHKLDALGTLAGGIAHDFNNLLMAMRGHLTLAAVEEGSSLANARIQALDRTIERAGGLTNQILTFAAGRTPTRSLTCVRGMIEEAASLPLVGSGLRLDLQMADEIPEAQLDAIQIGQVIHNLVLNAVQAMPQGGTVRVRVRSIPTPAHFAQAGRRDPYLSIEIEDEGEGVAFDLRQRIFDPFYTTKPKGTGLGLATSDQIVRQHGGSITVQGPPTGPSVFTIHIPLVSSKGVGRTTRGAGKTDTAPRRILVMDDDQDVREPVVALLRHLGHSVEACTHGQAAVDVYIQRLNGPETFDVVMLDLTVPGAMGGYEAMRLIRHAHPGAYIIAASGYAAGGSRAESDEHGFDDWLLKPYSLTQLGAAVARSRR